MIKVSVIIPVYNVEKFLPACLDSVLGQSLKELECICVDDASPDRCGEILDEYVKKDMRLQVVHLKTNQRQGYGRNLGMDLAHGKYIYFLDSDDMITPMAMEELYALAERDNLRCVLFDSQVIYDNDDLVKRFSSYPSMRTGSYPECALPGSVLFDLFIQQDEWTCYVQRQFWDLAFLRRNEIRFPAGVEHEDELFSFEGLLLADRVRYIRKDYFIRRYREASVMTTPPSAKNFHGCFMNFCKMDEFCRNHHIRNYAADRTMFRIFQTFERYYSDLNNKQNLSEWFRPDELPLFQFYDRIRIVREYHNVLDEVLIDELRKYQFIYIYGAGVRGRKAISCLTSYEFAVDGVVVTKAEDNPSVLMGHKVIPIKELHADKESSVLLLAMTKSYVNEVLPELEKAGWNCLQFK